MGLRAAVYVAPPTPFKAKRPAPDGDFWSPIPCTLIYGDAEAILVDTPITIAQTNALADWIENIIPGRNLSTVCITHRHDDHWLGLPTLRMRWPGLSAVATKGTIEHIKHDASPSLQQSRWEKLFPNQIDHGLMVPQPLPDHGKLLLEGHTLQAIDVGHSDTYGSTVLWVPDLKLAVCGDVVYGDVHQMLVEANTPELQLEWMAAIEKIEALGPSHVVPGHKKAGEIDGIYHLAASKKYLQDFMRISKSSTTADELYGRMLEIYPSRYNPAVLRWGADTAFRSQGKL